MSRRRLFRALWAEAHASRGTRIILKCGRERAIHVQQRPWPTAAAAAAATRELEPNALHRVNSPTSSIVYR